jgi:hypothetical protein
LLRPKEGFAEFAFAANGEGGKAFEPSSRGHLRLSIEPSEEKSKLGRSNFAQLNPVEQVIVKCGR